MRLSSASAMAWSASAVACWRGPSQDRAARGHLDSGDAPAVEHYEPVAVFAAQYAAIFCQGHDDVLQDLVRGGVPSP